MDPPPAPMVWMSIIGTCSGQAPTRPSVVTSASPPRTRHTSALVPPTSTEMRSSNPAASPTRRAPITPAAGPDSAVWMAWVRTTSAPMTPPLDFMIDSGARIPRGRSSPTSRAT
jgi:hypothetical protein